MAETTALLVGESWQTISFHVKGFDMFSNAEYTEAGEYWRRPWRRTGSRRRISPVTSPPRSFPSPGRRWESTMS